MIRCPHCAHGISTVRDTRPRDNYIYRRRRCSNCHRLFTTYEMNDQDLPASLSNSSSLVAIKVLLERMLRVIERH